MECNKEEAVRAQQIAETKFKARDFNGAKRFAMKALNLNPSLEGLSQMLPVIDVHMISQQTIGNGEKDWYGILQVDPVANDATIKSQYKKLCLLFHPDKNKALGAESAFKLISDAWMVLSDRSKKLLYDSKRKFPRPPNVKANVDEIRSRGQSSGMKPDLRKVETEGGPTLAQLKAEVEKKLKAEKSLQMQKERERLVKESDFILKRRIAAEELKKREREVKKEIHTEKKKMSNLERRKKARGVEPAEADLQNVCNETFEGIQFSSTSERSTQDRSKRLETRFEARAARAQECASPIPKDKVESTHQSADIASINPAASTCLQNDPAKRKKTLSELIGHEAARSKQTTDMESITLEHNLEGPEVEEIPISVLQAESVAPELPCSSSYLHTVRKRPNGSENLPAIVPEVIVQASLKARIREDELAPGEEDFLNVARGTVADENEETRAQGLNNDAKSKIDEDLERDSARARTDMSVRKGKQVFGAEATVNSSCSDHKQVDSRKSYRGVESVAQYINIFSHCVSYKLREDPVLIYPLKDEIWAIYLDWMQKLRGNVEGHRDSKNSNQSYELVEILHDYSEKQGVLTARLAKTPGFSAVFHRTGAKQYFSPSQLPAFSHRVLSGKVPKNIKLGITGDAYELDPAGLPESMILGNPSPH
ncbi:hypothetical protein AXG93_3873s1310 [Marchantia polymorpha subsp. ruderalis]|uniref:J domain-containing protein n=1 Tax=Marchantia polymorpha subsp. ruderalis TaxID=1480154 RepID=A0A176VJI0_MARPO|nr:hypothetical protein AXG93_3873s1310 [Marchantia polymorpha subsp. ruderalis]